MGKERDVETKRNASCTRIKTGGEEQWQSKGYKCVSKTSSKPGTDSSLEHQSWPFLNEGIGSSARRKRGNCVGG